MTIAYIVKYWETQGIIEREVEIYEDHMARVVGHFGYFSNKDYFLSKSAAREECRKRRDRKIISLQRKINKLENMNFNKGTL